MLEFLLKAADARFICPPDGELFGSVGHWYAEQYAELCDPFKDRQAPVDDGRTPTPPAGPRFGELRLCEDGGFHYVPQPGFTGRDAFYYRLCEDSMESQPVLVTIYVRDEPEPEPDPEPEPIAAAEPGLPEFGTSGIEHRFLQDVVPQELQWLAAGEIPLGKLTLLLGESGVGKSLWAVDLAARVSRGELGSAEDEEPPRVLWIPTHDDLADTVRPRLDLAEADVSRISALTGLRFSTAAADRQMLAEELQRLDAALAAEPQTRLVVIDSLTTDARTGTARAARIDDLLQALAQLAKKHQVALVILSGRDSLFHRANGSLLPSGFAPAAAAVHAIVGDPDVAGQRLFVPLRMNLAAMPGLLSFRMEEGRLVWQPNPLPCSAEEVGRHVQASRAPDAAQRRDALGWLRNYLLAGPQAAKEVFADGASCGYSAGILRRAKAELGVESVKLGFDEARWMWCLPQSGTAETVEGAVAVKTPGTAEGIEGAEGARARSEGEGCWNLGKFHSPWLEKAESPEEAIARIKTACELMEALEADAKEGGCERLTAFIEEQRRRKRERRGGEWGRG